MKQLLRETSSAGKIFYLFLFSLLGLIIGSGILSVVSLFIGEHIGETVWQIHLSTFIQSIFVFILPAVLVVSLTQRFPKLFFKLHASSRLLSDIFFGIIVFTVSYAFVSFLTQWNKTIELPEILAPIEQWMHDMETAAMETTNKLLSGKTVVELIANLFFVAFMAALSEEIFFRGALQQFLHQLTKNGHAAVWLSSFIFSAIHLQFYGFFPRLVLGALLGYLFLYSRNLWIPIIVHFINNASVIVVTFFWSDRDWFKDIETPEITTSLVIIASISVMMTIAMFRIYLSKNKTKIEKKEGMIQIQNTILSDDIFEENFICDLRKCKGQCCVDGDSGAPLTKEENDDIQRILPKIWNELSPKAQNVIEKQGISYVDYDGELVTSIIDREECVFTYFDSDGICKCVIDTAFREGRIDVQKPISCHLYPIRLQEYSDFTALNYHRWSVCRPAVKLGNEEGVAIYQFLKEPLIRKFGQEWYDEVCEAAKLLKKEEE